MICSRTAFRPLSKQTLGFTETYLSFGLRIFDCIKINMDKDILKISTDWAKAEVFSGKMIWMFSALFLLSAIGFWYLGRTHMAKAFTWPLLVAGGLLIAVGAGLIIANKPRIAQFEKAFLQGPDVFVQNEIARTTESQKQLTLVFRILPAIVIIGSLIILGLPGSPNWRAIGITLIVTTAFLMIVDSNTDSRNSLYRSQLLALMRWK
jgi:ABC-2 type transport system permease protein